MRYDKLNDIVLEDKKVTVFAEYDDVYRQKYNPELLLVDSEWVDKPYRRLLKKQIRDFKEHFTFEDLLTFTPFVFMTVPIIICLLYWTSMTFNRHLTAGIAGMIAVALVVGIFFLVALHYIGEGILAKVFAEWLFKGKRFKMDNKELLIEADSYDEVQRFVISSENYRPVEKIEEEVAEKSKKSTFGGTLKNFWTKKERNHVKKRQAYLERLANIFCVEVALEPCRDNLHEARADHYVRFLASLDADELQFFVNTSLRLKALPAEIDDLQKLAAKNIHWKRNVLSKDLADRITQREDEQKFCRKVLSDFDERFEEAWHDEQVGEVDAETLKALAA